MEILAPDSSKSDDGVLRKLVQASHSYLAAPRPRNCTTNLTRPKARCTISITTLQIIDSAIKIGLGAAIAGAAAILVARHNNSHELRILRYTRRLDAIEAVAEAVSEHFTACDVLFGTLAVAYDHVNAGADGPLENDWDAIRSADSGFMESLSALTAMSSRLRLFGESGSYRSDVPPL